MMQNFGLVLVDKHPCYVTEFNRIFLILKLVGKMSKFDLSLRAVNDSKV